MRRMRWAVTRSDRGSEAATRGARRAPGREGPFGLGVPDLPGGDGVSAGLGFEVAIPVVLAPDATTDSGLKLDVAGAFVGRGVGTRAGAAAPVVITVSYYPTSAS